jgi:hypothetical protein
MIQGTPKEPMTKSDNLNFRKECLAFMREVGLVTDNNLNYYSPLLGPGEWFVIVWGNDIRVVNDVYIADNDGTVCTTNAKTVNTLKSFKAKLTYAIKKSKKLTVYLRKRTIEKDFEKDDE